MYVGPGLSYSTIESALQECTDNYLGLQNVETSIFIKEGVYKPKNPLRCSIYGETSTINFIGEGIDKTILECHELKRVIALQMNILYQSHTWTFKDMTIKGCENNFGSIKVTSGTINFENVKFTGNNNKGAIELIGTANAKFINTIFIDNYQGPNLSLATSGNIEIYNSELLGFPQCFYVDNPLCKDTLINILSSDRLTLIIDNTVIANSYCPTSDEFDEINDYRTSIGAINYKSITIKNSEIKNNVAYSSGTISLSFWQSDIYPKLKIYNTTFVDNFGAIVGAVRVAGYMDVDIDQCTFYNNTSIYSGIIHNSGDLTQDNVSYPTTISISNSYFENPNVNNNEVNVSGRIYSSLGTTTTNIINTVFKNFHDGDLYRALNSKIISKNCVFSNMKINVPLFYITNEKETFEFDECTFENIDIKHDEYGLIYTNQHSGNLIVTNSHFTNITSYNAAILLSEINFGNNIYLKSNHFDNVYSKNGCIVIKNEEFSNLNGIIIDDTYFNNCSGGKMAILSVDYGSFCNITNSEFTNCGFSKNKINSDEYENLSGSIIHISGNSIVNLENVTINGCSCKDSGGAINLSLNSKLNIYKSNFINCNAKKNSGVLYFNNWDGTLNIDQTNFMDNVANNYGGVFDLSGENVLDNARINIDNSKFLNNSAILGGVIYIGTITSNFNVSKQLKINNSQFKDNNARAGQNLFINKASQAVNIFNSNNYNDKMIDSHPRYLSWNDKSFVDHLNERKFVKSGDSISNGLTAYILSDTNRLYNIVDESTRDLSSVLFVNATMLNIDGTPTKDAVIHGDRETFCWSGKCILNSVKIYGNPGDYLLQLYMISDGGFITMNSQKITVDVTIEECDKSHRNDYLGVGFNLCYTPVCSTPCVHGECVDMQTCKCDSSGIWTGSFCNERYKYEYSKTLRIIIETICSLSALFSIFLIYGIQSNKKEPSIRKSNPTFLIVTVVGSLINYSTVIFYHGNRTTTLCSIVLWVKFIGFAVLYGSIIIRIMRVWKIISSTKQKFKTSSMTKTAMFSYLFVIISIYIIILVVCTIIQKTEIKECISKNKAFSKCGNTQSIVILYGLTIGLLIWGVYLALETSNLPEQFNEAKSVGISTYVYSFAMIVSEFIDNYTELNPDYSFLLMTISMLIYTWTSIFTIVVPKVYVVYAEWFVIFDILKRNVHGTENAVTVESEISNGNYMNNIENNVGGLSIINRQ
ncbi:hypothetical protein BCR32DRAFT_266758 [Anaeromyces robustus]|uniref:G-protein coupled receptors family 3 profile domain-containing protein n=1 Tax=Anaeromyces robustus TaxID=1754192 RepID=A0A1Y1XEK1_9FUNG|nr:hypothetical protein BCR32DRAFT_266758 [Anaeromyces robustus]|eukprot:ORX83804.1 hypothetical protein BCR32DRAFT_266758 [Anaeromyces robustus]